MQHLVQRHSYCEAHQKLRDTERSLTYRYSDENSNAVRCILVATQIKIRGLITLLAPPCPPMPQAHHRALPSGDIQSAERLGGRYN